MLIKLYEKNNSPKALQNVIDLLNDGGILIYPTDTTYALGCHALKERAVEKICQIKNIDPKKNRLSLICYNLSMISEFAKVSDEAFKLMKRNLPGAFTFILPTGSKLPKIYKNRKEVGIRMPDSPIIQEIARLLEAPILSASLPWEEDEDQSYLTDPELIHEKFGNTVDLIIDGGLGGTEVSTVVDCVSGLPEITRQGKAYLL